MFSFLFQLLLQCLESSHATARSSIQMYMDLLINLRSVSESESADNWEMRRRSTRGRSQRMGELLVTGAMAESDF